VKSSIVGLWIGLLLGAVLVFKGFGAMLTVAFFGLLGYAIVRVVQGEIDLTPYLGGRRRR